MKKARECRVGSLSPLWMEKDLKRFMKFVVKPDNDNSCWYWTGTIIPRGYGMFCLNNKMYLAHRISYEHFVGSLNNLQCLHKCDNRRCVNPAHLFLGNDKDNADDCKRKGRCGSAKLTVEQVSVIKKLIPKQSPTLIAYSFGVCKGTIDLIRQGKIWKEVV